MTQTRTPNPHPEQAVDPDPSARDLEDAARDLGRRADRLAQSENAPREREEGVGPVSGVVP